MLFLFWIISYNEFSIFDDVNGLHWVIDFKDRFSFDAVFQSELLAQILKETSHGRPVSIVPIATELTTQATAELLGCSRPHVIKLLESGEIKFTKVGKHRRIRYEDVVNFKSKMKARQENLINEIINTDEVAGLYDS